MYFDYKCCKLLPLQDMSLVNEVDMALFAIPRLMVGSSMFVPWYYKSIVWGNYFLNDTVKKVAKLLTFEGKNSKNFNSIKVWIWILKKSRKTNKSLGKQVVANK